MKAKRWLVLAGAVGSLFALGLFAVFSMIASRGSMAQSPAYSMTPIPINQQLFHQAANMGFLDARNPEPRFSFHNSSDLAAIAAGRIQAVGLLKAGSSLRDGFVDAAPTEPLLVKSYDQYVQDYYLVPFVKNGKPSGLVVLYLENGKVHCGHAARYADTATQPLPVMKDQAIAILKNAYQLESVPDPRLIYQGLCQEIHDPLQPAWEFDLGGKKAYVNQEGKVFTAFTRPEKLGG